MQGAHQNTSKGFGLVEMIMGLAILAIASTILVGVFSSFRAPQDMNEAHSNIIGFLQEARAKTLSSYANYNYGIHFEESKIVLFRGPSYNAMDTNNQNYVLPVSVRISAVSLTGGAVDTVFTRLQGTTTASGSITLESKRSSATKNILISSTGIVE